MDLLAMRRLRRKGRVRTFVPSLAALGCLLCFASSASPGFAAEPRVACTSEDCRREALHEMPLAQLHPQDRQVAENVINSTSIYRRMPTQVIDCDPHMFLFLMKNPEVIVNIWKLMGISKVTLDRASESQFQASDGEGTTCTITMLHASHDKHLIFAEGTYDGPLFRNPVKAQVLLFLRANYIRETNGRHYVTCKLDAFIQLQRGGVELLAKAFQSLLGRSADVNFAETMGFVSSLSRTAEVNPEGTQRIARRLTNVDPTVRDQLETLVGQLAERSEKAEALRQVNHDAVEPETRTYPRR